MKNGNISRVFITILRKHEISIEECSQLIFSTSNLSKLEDEKLSKIIKLLRRYRHNLDAMSEKKDGILVALIFKDDYQAQCCMEEIGLITSSDFPEGKKSR